MSSASTIVTVSAGMRSLSLRTATVLYFSAILPYGETPPQYPACSDVSWHSLELRRATYDSMPDGYMFNIWVLVSDIPYCMLQTVRESLLVGFEISPASIELVFAMGVLLCLVKV